MLLQRLKEYAVMRLAHPPTLYTEGPLRYVIELDSQGRLLNPVPIDTAEPGNRLTRRGQRRLLPQVVRAAGVKPLLLADKADYVLGFVAPDGKTDRTAACHAAFLDILDRCASSTQETAVQSVSAFLHDSPLDKLTLPDGFDPSGIISFRVGDVFPIDLPTVQQFWAQEHDPATKSARVMQCLVCGTQQPVVERLQAKIKGVPGGQTAGTSIISANSAAFESYGLEASLGAPTCAACGERFTQGANDLIARRETHISMGGAVFLFWTREDVGFDPFTLLDRPEPEHVQALYESLAFGKRPPDLERVNEVAFFAASLSGSGGRAVVRDWIDTTVGHAKEHLARWHRLQEIVDRDGGAPRPLGLYALAAATVRDANKELSPPTPRALLRAAFAETPVPVGLMEQAVRRCRAEQGVTRPRAALIKLVLASNGMIPEGGMVGLDTGNTNIAYRCGRLLAVLEEIQRRALGEINATVVDRFYGTASSAPVSVFPRLMNGSKAHLHKLRRDRLTTHNFLQRQLGEIADGIQEFPRAFNLQNQGLFALGYYHQRVALRSPRHAVDSQARNDEDDVSQSNNDA